MPTLPAARSSGLLRANRCGANRNRKTRPRRPSVVGRLAAVVLRPLGRQTPRLGVAERHHEGRLGGTLPRREALQQQVRGERDVDVVDPPDGESIERNPIHFAAARPKNAHPHVAHRTAGTAVLRKDNDRPRTVQLGYSLLAGSLRIGARSTNSAVIPAFWLTDFTFSVSAVLPAARDTPLTVTISAPAWSGAASVVGSTAIVAPLRRSKTR